MPGYPHLRARYAALGETHLALTVRGDLLARDGRDREAAEAFRAAAARTRNQREQEVLLDRAARLSGGDPGREHVSESADLVRRTRDSDSAPEHRSPS